MKWTRPLGGAASMSQNDFKTNEIMEPQEASRMKEMSVLGIDIAKRVFPHSIVFRGNPLSPAQWS
jgi:hypothetical protein